MIYIIYQNVKKIVQPSEIHNINKYIIHNFFKLIVLHAYYRSKPSPYLDKQQMHNKNKRKTEREGRKRREEKYKAAESANQADPSILIRFMF